MAQSLPKEAWQEVTWDQGSKGPLRSRFAAVRVHAAHGCREGVSPRPEEWLLIEWPKGEPKPTDYWLSNLPADTPPERSVRLAKMRWHIEQDYQQLKEELGLDHLKLVGMEPARDPGDDRLRLPAPGAVARAKRGHSDGPAVTLPQVRRMLQYVLATWTGVCMTCGRRLPRRFRFHPHC